MGMIMAYILASIVALVALAWFITASIVAQAHRRTAEAYEEAFEHWTDEEMTEQWEKLGDSFKKAGISAADFARTCDDVSAKGLYQMNDDGELELVNLQVKEGCYVEDKEDQL